MPGPRKSILVTKRPYTARFPAWNLWSFINCTYMPRTRGRLTDHVDNLIRSDTRYPFMILSFRKRICPYCMAWSWPCCLLMRRVNHRYLGVLLFSLSQNGLYPMNAHTIVYMPHCDMELYENLLRANWKLHTDALKLLFIANQLSDYLVK